MEGELLLPLYLYRLIRLDFVTFNLVVVLDYTIIILGGEKRREYLFLDGFPSAEEMEGYRRDLFSYQGKRNREGSGKLPGRTGSDGWGKGVEGHPLLRSA